MADEFKAPVEPLSNDGVAKAVVSHLNQIGINENFVSSLFRNQSVKPWPGKLGKYIGLQVFGDNEQFHSINIIDGINLEYLDEPQELPASEIRTFSADPNFRLSNFLQYYNVSGYQQVIILKKNYQTDKYDLQIDGKEHFYGYINKERKKFKIVGYSMTPKVDFGRLGISASSFELTMNNDNSALYGNASIYKYEGYDMKVNLNEIYHNLQNLIDNSRYQEGIDGVNKIVTNTGSNDDLSKKIQRDLWFHIEIEMINKVDSKTQCFDALFTVYYEWTLTTSDFYKYAAMSENYNNSDESFEPDWKPKLPRFPNSIEIKQIEASNIEIKSLSQRLHYNNNNNNNNSDKSNDDNNNGATFDGKRLFYATQSFTVRGTFTERLELKHFPFDCQDLKVYIETNIYDKECCVHPLKTVTRGMSQRASVAAEMASKMENIDEVLRVSKMNDESVSEWHFSEAPKWDLHYICKEDIMHHKNDFEAIIVFNVKAERAWAIYFWRIFLINFLINLTCLGAFTHDIIDSFGDRLQFCLTLLLTDVAYSLVVAESLPTLKYLTILDQVILASYIYIFLITVASGIIGYFSWRFDVDSDTIYWMDSICFAIFTLLLAVAAIACVIYVKANVIPRELKKLKTMWQLNDVLNKTDRMYQKNENGEFVNYNQQLEQEIKSKIKFFD